MNGEKFIELVRKGSIEPIVELLSGEGAIFVNHQDKSTGRSALHYAAG